MGIRDLFKKTETVAAGEVKRMMEGESQKDFLLLDVREPREYAGGHLPGALHIPLSQLAEGLNKLDRSRPVVTY